MQTAQRPQAGGDAPAAADEQARQWLARLHSGSTTAQDRTRFEAWLTAAAEHPRAYRRAEQIWRDLRLIDALGEVNIESLGLAQRLRSRPVLAAAACIVAGVLGVLTVLSLGDRHATQVAEIRELTLPDGTRVVLGARSAIDVDFNDAKRQVRLKTGEAFFSVAKDAIRPFYVSADDTQVRVLGTQFYVHHGAGEVRVAVTEGRVEVLSGADDGSHSTPWKSAEKRVLTAGQELVAAKTATVGGSLLIRNIDPAQPGAWRSGRLNYENASLAEVIADANRYSAREIVCADDRVCGVRITAAFRTEQIDELLAGLAASHPIVIDRSRSDRIVLRPQP